MDSKCVACSRASSGKTLNLFLAEVYLTCAAECLFDAPPDGVLRGHA